MKIKDIQSREILDSRGNPTIETAVYLDNGSKGIFAVPSGASTGSKEALELRDGDMSRFEGQGVLKAIDNVHSKILPAVKDANLDQGVLDDIMINLDGTENKSNLGANAILSVSISFAIAAAASEGKEVFEYISNLSGQKTDFPYLCFNIINGGKHASSSLPFQEYMLCPYTVSMRESIEIASVFIHALKKYLIKNLGPFSANIGDEGGFAPQVSEVSKPLEILMDVARELKMEDKIKLSVDAAANSFCVDSRYILGNDSLASDDLLNLDADLVSKFPFLFLEDPFSENDEDGFIKINDAIGDKVIIVADDLTVTNKAYIKNSIEKKSASGFIIKINQIGTLTETLESVKLIKENNLKPIISHRSGETNSDFISDLAVGVGAFGIKAGAPQRGERVAKYNRFLAIEGILKNK